MLRKFALVAVVGIATAAGAQAPSIYPAKGQSPEQVDKDKGECHVWAVSETGFDPAAQPAPPPTITVAGQQRPVAGSGARARGAARGAVAGEVLGDDAGTGAAVGAVAAGSRQRRANRAAAAPTEQPNPEYEQYTRDKAHYDGAVKACLTGRGYTLS